LARIPASKAHPQLAASTTPIVRLPTITKLDAASLSKAHSGQVIRKNQEFSGFARASLDIQTKPDNVKAVSESSENRLVLPVMGLTP
jgi:hypothetical protein